MDKQTIPLLLAHRFSFPHRSRFLLGTFNSAGTVPPPNV